MKIAAAMAIANAVENIDRDNIVPETLDMTVGPKVAKAVFEAIQPEDRL
jgi:malic enzyme